MGFCALSLSVSLSPDFPSKFSTFSFQFVGKREVSILFEQKWKCNNAKKGQQNES